MRRFGRPNVLRMYVPASLPILLPFGLFLFLIFRALSVSGMEEIRLDWNLLMAIFQSSLFTAFSLALIATVIFLGVVVISASLSNRWFRRSRRLIAAIAAIPPILLIPVGGLILQRTNHPTGTALALVVIANGSWFAHYSLNRMAATRQVTWQAMQGLGATRWQIVRIIYWKQALHHTLDLVPFLTTRILGQVLLIGIFAPHWMFPPAQLWMGWAAASGTPTALQITTVELLLLLGMSMIINHIAYRLSRRSWEVYTGPGHFFTIWSDQCE